MLFKFLEKPIEITAFVREEHAYVHDYSPIYFLRLRHTIRFGITIAAVMVKTTATNIQSSVVIV